jgi:hypothetical protein
MTAIMTVCQTGAKEMGYYSHTASGSRREDKKRPIVRAVEVIVSLKLL